MTNFPCTAAIAISTCIALSGCSGSLKLLEDGKVHAGNYDQLSKVVRIDVDGVPYTGTFVQSASAGFGTAFAGTVPSTSTFVSSDGSGQALLSSPDGKVLRCVFGSIVGWRGQGRCQNNAGKTYDLLIGS